MYIYEADFISFFPIKSRKCHFFFFLTINPMLSEIADNPHASNINNAYKIVKHMEEKRSLDGQNEKMKNSTPVWNIHREVHIPGYWLYAECLPHCLAQEQFDFVCQNCLSSTRCTHGSIFALTLLRVARKALATTRKTRHAIPRTASHWLPSGFLMLLTWKYRDVPSSCLG